MFFKRDGLRIYHRLDAKHCCVSLYDVDCWSLSEMENSCLVNKQQQKRFQHV